ncbi:recombinase family protein, partial [Clostridium estertheticum]|nr:recombinase family protein [Clostridium estertheticum]MBU3218443.1 recombinase family protein [Clostridium estertheticum]
MWGVVSVNSVYAYIRVSTKEQNTDRQHEALKEYATSNKL